VVGAQQPETLPHPAGTGVPCVSDDGDAAQYEEREHVEINEEAAGGPPNGVG
jgi:hypothetical protein